MGLISEEVEITLTNNIKYYEDLGYEIPRNKNKQGKLRVPVGSKILVKVNDLSKYSKIKVNIECDNCGCKILNVDWANYLTSVKEDDKYYCFKCSHKLYVGENIKQTRLKKGKSFKQWCLENNRQDILDRWDYELNDCKPNEINHGTNKKYYFKCTRGLHRSELKNIKQLTNRGINFICNQCNSIAQWGIDNIGEDFLDKYWDYEKNTVNPWEISYSSAKKIWIKCQEVDYHNNYIVCCFNFVNGTRCPYCSKHNSKVHFLDSLGTFFPLSIKYWSDKNKKSPYEYTPFSSQKAWWKCPNRKHKDFFRIISSSNIYNYRCPECENSKGEKRISKYFNNNNFVNISEEDYKLLDDISKFKYKYYMTQKKFDNLIGLGNGLLSYDFYLPQYNLLIEYQGEQHEKYIPGFHKSKKDFEKQLEHDRRKKEYAHNNNINLLEIWYYDFDNIETILKNELNFTNSIN